MELGINSKNIKCNSTLNLSLQIVMATLTFFETLGSFKFRTKIQRNFTISSFQHFSAIVTIYWENVCLRSWIILFLCCACVFSWAGCDLSILGCRQGVSWVCWVCSGPTFLSPSAFADLCDKAHSAAPFSNLPCGISPKRNWEILIWGHGF